MGNVNNGNNSTGLASLSIVQRLIGDARANDFSLIVDGSGMPIASSSNEDSVYYCNKTGTSNGVTFTVNKVYRCIYDSEAQSSYSYAEVGEGLLCAIEQYNCFNKKSGKYMVDCFYFRANPLEVDPVFFAGTVWEKIEDRFIMGASSSHPANSTGGNSNVTLALENITPHDGHMYDNNSSYSPRENEQSNSYFLDASNLTSLDQHNDRPFMIVSGNEARLRGYTKGGSNGVAQPFDITPPYKATVIYQRLPNNTVIS